MAKTTTGTASWGVTAAAPIAGVITDYEESVTASLAPQYNEVGAICKMTKYDEVTTITATVEVATGTKPPEPGSSISFGGKSAYVKDAKVVESNSAYRKISITAEFTQNVKTTASA